MSGLFINLLRRRQTLFLLNKYYECPIQYVPSLITCKYFNLYSILNQKQQSAEPGKDEPKKKSKPLVRITLLAKNDDMTVTTLDEAHKLARRRDLKLIKVQDIDNKTQRPVYKLVTAAEYFAEELKSTAINYNETQKDSATTKKGEKLLTIGSRISEHDLSSRIKQITKWLDKGHEARILIQGSSSDNSSEKIFSIVSSTIKEAGRILQKRSKNGNIHFNVVPINQQQS